MRILAQILDRLICVKLYCGVQNYPKGLRYLNNKLEFSSTIAEIAVADEKETADAQKVAGDEIIFLAPVAKSKLVAKDVDVSKPKNKEMCLLLVTLYSETENLEKNKKWTCCIIEEGDGRKSR